MLETENECSCLCQQSENLLEGRYRIVTEPGKYSSVLSELKVVLLQLLCLNNTKHRRRNRAEEERYIIGFLRKDVYIQILLPE